LRGVWHLFEKTFVVYSIYFIIYVLLRTFLIVVQYMTYCAMLGVLIDSSISQLVK